MTHKPHKHKIHELPVATQKQFMLHKLKEIMKVPVKDHKTLEETIGRIYDKEECVCVMKDGIKQCCDEKTGKCYGPCEDLPMEVGPGTPESRVKIPPKGSKQKK